MLAYSFYESDSRVIQYAKTLAARGDSVDVFALRREGMAAFEVLEGVKLYRIQLRNVNEQGRLIYLFRVLGFLLCASLVIARKHLSKAYDVVHVHSVPDFLVFGAVVPKILGARVILDIHDILPEFYASKFGVRADSIVFKGMVLVEKLSIAFADHVIIANDLWRQKLVTRSLAAGKCTVFLNYPDQEIFYMRPKLGRSEKFQIIYPGTLNYHQGLDIAIRAFASVSEEMPEAEFHIYGEGPMKPSLMALTRDLNLSERVIFRPFLPISEIAEVMARSDLAIVPKRASSGFGNEAVSTKITELMALGIPVIAARTKIETYYHDASRIRFFESENERELAQAVLELRNDAKLRERLALNASRYVAEHNWQQKSQEYLHLVDALANRIRTTGRRRHTGRSATKSRG